MGGAPYMLTKQGGGHSLRVSMSIYKGVPMFGESVKRGIRNNGIVE